MWEIIKMIFFRIMFIFWLVCAIVLLISRIEEWKSKLELELDEIEKRKNKEQKESYERTIKFLYEYSGEQAQKYYKLLMRYYDILSFEICWKTVEEWEREDRKVSRKKK